MGWRVTLLCCLVWLFTAACQCSGTADDADADTGTGEDAATGADASADADAASGTDASAATDAATSADTSVAADAATGTDASPAVDAGMSRDTGVGADAGSSVAASSCEQGDVQAAINAATPGDTVVVPAGTCTWSSTVEVSQDINLQGTGTTILRSGAGTQLLSFLSAGELSGFHFDAGAQSEQWSGDILWFDGAPRIHDNTFESDTGLWMIKGTASPGTLIDSNTFSGAAAVMHLYGNGDADFDNPVTYGGAGFAFVEDNTFDMAYGSGGESPAIDYDEGGLVVFRHNSLHNSYFENHDRCRSSLTSARAFEIYGNAFTVDGAKWKAIDLSSGDGVIFDNTIDGDWAVPIGVYQSREGTCDLPPDEVPGAIEPIYVWNNTANGAPTELQCTSSAAACAEMTIRNGEARPGYSPYPYPHPRR